MKMKQKKFKLFIIERNITDSQLNSLRKKSILKTKFTFNSYDIIHLHTMRNFMTIMYIFSGNCISKKLDKTITVQ